MSFHNMYFDEKIKKYFLNILLSGAVLTQNLNYLQ